MITKLKTNSKIFCFCENKPKCVSLLVHWSWLLNFNTNLTCFTFSPWYLPLICWRSLIFETKYPYFGRIVPFLVFLLHFWYFSFKFGTAIKTWGTGNEICFELSNRIQLQYVTAFNILMGALAIYRDPPCFAYAQLTWFTKTLDEILK